MIPIIDFKDPSHLKQIEEAYTTVGFAVFKNAISDYGHLIDNSYIVWANSIIFQMIEEKMEDITLMS